MKVCQTFRNSVTSDWHSGLQKSLSVASCLISELHEATVWAGCLQRQRGDGLIWNSAQSTLFFFNLSGAARCCVGLNVSLSVGTDVTTPNSNMNVICSVALWMAITLNILFVQADGQSYLYITLLSRHSSSIAGGNFWTATQIKVILSNHVCKRSPRRRVNHLMVDEEIFFAVPACSNDCLFFSLKKQSLCA